MGIHHATLKKAEKMGVVLAEQDDGLVLAHWTEFNIRVLGDNTSDVMREIQAAQAIKNMNPDIRLEPAAIQADITHFRAFLDERIWDDDPMLASELHAKLINGDDEWVDVDEPDTPIEVERSEKGIALDGAIAYAEGTPAGDNPFFPDEDGEEYEELREKAEAWDEAWDAAADEAEEEEKDGGGSVVSSKYRAKYAELGHPTHCGDWLANLLNNLCLTDDGTDLDRFEAICAANNVDLTKYNRTTPGWQGRIRMTGRNLLAKRVYEAGGVVNTPVEGAEEKYQAPADWMSAQRFKMPKKDQNKPIPTAAE